MMNGKGPETRDFDLVLMCLRTPGSPPWLGRRGAAQVDGQARRLFRPARALSARFDPVRRAVLGRQNQGLLVHVGSLRRLLAFYNEGSRHDVGKHGVLNWLIAGSDALAFANLGDQELIAAALKSLAASFGDARAHFMEGKIHRWLSSVNALPGGLPARDVMTNHRPSRSSIPAWSWSAIICSIRPSTACSIPPTPPPTSS